MVLGQNVYFSLDDYQTQRNNNVLVVGASGTGKTRGIVIPNILMASGSYVITDPKGNLYKKYGQYLKDRGYDIKLLDFSNPAVSNHYNFFEYINSSQDILKIANMLIYQKKDGGHYDPFWDESGQLLLQALIAYLMEAEHPRDRTLHNLLELLTLCQVGEDSVDRKNALDMMFAALKRKNQNSYAVKYYEMFRLSPARTLRSILITVAAKIGRFDTPETKKMMAYDDIDISSIGKKKTAVFVVVSDTDRSMDGLVNIFFTQAMNELCRYADNECPDNRLPVRVRFIMDDFATNCKIEEFPRMISSIRSRGISTMLMIQSEGQLTESYDHDGKTIIANCDTYMYLGGNDIETAKAIAERCDVPLSKIVYMPIGTNWLFRRGYKAFNGINCDLDRFIREMGLNPQGFERAG